MSHYDYLEDQFMDFYRAACQSCGVAIDLNVNEGLIGAHGDKCYSYRDAWRKAGLRFEQGVAIYLLTHLSPWSAEVRMTEHGWVAPYDWVVANAERFLPFLS